jgi:hypothetical protein
MPFVKTPVIGWFAAAAIWILLIAISSYPPFRNMIAAPLIQTEEEAVRDSAYVLSVKVAKVPFAATSFKESAEIYDPLWLEYLKLFVCRLIA